jgi:penicillin amidase/acyl-homoserine-lactone acylase
VPGDTSANIWAMDDLLDAPVLNNPSSGWLYSTNGAPWSSTDPSADMRPEQYPQAAPAIETYITNRGYRAVEQLSPLRTISADQLLAAKFDLTSSERSATMAAVNEILAADSSNDADLAEIQALLRTSDRRAANDSPAAALAGLIYQPIYNAGRPNTAPPAPIEAARAGARRLRATFSRIDPPLGDLLRLRRGDVDLPLEGATDVLRAIRWHDDPDGRAVGDFGDGFMMVIDWAPDGSLTTRVISQWGASDRPDSPHYNDQSEMFIRREWRTVEVLPIPGVRR